MQRDAYATNRSMSFALGDGPANALALSKDNSRVVVAGRNGTENIHEFVYYSLLFIMIFKYKVFF